MTAQPVIEPVVAIAAHYGRGVAEVTWRISEVSEPSRVTWRENQRRFEKGDNEK
jgi:hypothetical protein